MDGFSYFNIFETKGIEYLAIIAFFMILIPFWFFLNKKVKITKQIHRALRILSPTILRIPQGLFYTKNHTWTHLEKSGSAVVGVDDLLLHLTGEVKFSNLKSPGEKINKGDVLTEIDQTGKSLKVYSPISGEILRTNPVLIENPELLNEDPFNKGWMYKIKPSNWKAETNSYLLADEATTWFTAELLRFKDFLATTRQKYSPEPTMVILQEGGELMENPLSELPDEVWQDFQTDFLNHVE